MNTSGITVALPAQDLSRAKAFYAEKVGLQALESDFLKARDGQVGLTVGEGVSQLFVFPARVKSSGEFTQAVIHVADVRAAVEEMRGRGAWFEEYDTPETRTENGIARMRISRVSEPPRRVVYPRRLVQTVCYRLTHSELVDLRVWAIKADSTPSRAKSAFGVP
jgi:predicted enzyme related to lactoylglutathione lyase